jgi:hypothetical protein
LQLILIYVYYTKSNYGLQRLFLSDLGFTRQCKQG